MPQQKNRGSQQQGVPRPDDATRRQQSQDQDRSRQMGEGQQGPGQPKHQPDQIDRDRPRADKPEQT